MHLTTEWMLGFVDGEGCFSIRVSRHPTSRLGYNVQPTFQITQHADDVQVLEGCKAFFQCGTVRPKRRGTNQTILDYRVEKLECHRKRIVPFFEKHKLKTRKRQDFEIYRDVVRRLWQNRQDKRPLDNTRLLEIIEQASRMNHRTTSKARSDHLQQVREILKKRVEEETNLKIESSV